MPRKSAPVIRLRVKYLTTIYRNYEHQEVIAYDYTEGKTVQAARVAWIKANSHITKFKFSYPFSWL